MSIFSTFGRFGIALVAGLCAVSAQADNPVNGASLYANQCAGCHGNSPLTSNGSKIYNGRNARAVIDSAITGNTGGMGSLRSAFPSGGSALADVAAYLGQTPTSLTFAGTAVGSTSATQTVTVYASLKSGNALSGLSIATTGDFIRSGGTCGTTLGTGLNCTVLVAFKPTAAGASSGTLTVASNNTLTPVSIALNGTGTGVVVTAPIAAVAPTSQTFAATAVGVTSAAQNLTVSNSGTAALAISTITLSNTADFTIAGGTCAAGGSVPAGASCTVSVAFKPGAGAAGLRSGSLAIAHNAAGSPGTVSLSGTATAAAAPVAALTASLAFGSVNVGSVSTVQTATITNTGNAALTLGTLSTGSSEFSISGGSCAAGAAVAAGGSCSVNVSFTPTAAGARSATLVVTHNAAGAQSSASLSGTGVATSPVAAVSPASLSFSQTQNTTSAAQTVTVSNSGNAALVLGTLTLGGAQAAEFQIAAGSTCRAGSSIAANGSCAVQLTFTPTATGVRSASLAITHNATGSPLTVSLNGSGTATPQPTVALNAQTLDFGAQTVGSASAARSVTVTNSGAAPLTFGAFTLTGSNAADFTRGGTCSPAATLAVGASCTVAFTFTPASAGARSATLTLASNASNGSAALSLAGSGAAVATPAVSLAPSALDFGSQTTVVTSTARSVTLSNTGSGALAIGAITASSGFGVTHNCGASLPAAASCTLSIVFTPAASGAVNGSLTVTSNAAGSPHSVTLAGVGVAASPVLVWSPAASALAFGNASLGGGAAARTLTLVNQGPGAVSLQRFTLAGANAADFSLGNGGTCAINASLPQGGQCTLMLDFVPSAVGPRTARLQVQSSGTNPPDVALDGTGTAAAQAAAAVQPTALSFTEAAGASTPTQSLNLQSTGNAVLRVTALRVAMGSFTIAPATVNGCPTAPFDLMPGQACALAVGWSSSAVGSEDGMLEIESSAAAMPMQVAIRAVRAAAAPVDTPASAPGAATNVGGGGCTLARPGAALDPTLPLLLLAAGVLSWRRRSPPK